MKIVVLWLFLNQNARKIFGIGMSPKGVGYHHGRIFDPVMRKIN